MKIKLNKSILIFIYGFVTLHIFILYECKRIDQPKTEVVDKDPKHYLVKGDYEKAYETSREKYHSLDTTLNKDESLDQLFYMAVSRQKIGESLHHIGDTLAPNDTILLEAASIYKNILKNRPNSGAVIHNLAQIYALMNETNEAEIYFQRALTIDDSRNIFYRLNYAEFLQKNNQPDRSITVYEDILRIQPANIDIYHTLVELYCLHQKHKIIPLLWNLYENEQVIESQDLAIEALLKGQWAESDKIELLSIIVASMSKQFYIPSIIIEQDICKICDKLEQLTDDPTISGGIREIFMLYEDQNVNPWAFDWWRNQEEQWEKRTTGLWPRQSFRLLIRSLGDWYQQVHEYEKAESCFLLGAQFTPPEFDPEAFLKLIDLYLSLNQIDKLRDMARQYEKEIWTAKSQAYYHAQKRKIYEYHETLGIIYAIMKAWGDTSKRDSAIFQLEHALEIADEINSDATNQTDLLQVEPRIINYLAQGYEHRGNYNDGFYLRMDYAQKYLSYGDKKGANEVLVSIKIDEFPYSIKQSDKELYNRLLERTTEY